MNSAGTSRRDYKQSAFNSGVKGKHSTVSLYTAISKESNSKKFHSKAGVSNGSNTKTARPDSYASKITSPKGSNIKSKNDKKETNVPRADSENESETKTKYCPHCSEKHYLYKCLEFVNKTVKDRWDIVKEKKLCFNCLRKGHQSAECFSTISCRNTECNKRHHTLLHNTVDNNTDVQEVSVANAGRVSNSARVYLQMIPVRISGPSGHIMSTYALLDSASEISLIHEDLADDLGLTGPKKTLSIRTLTSEMSSPSRRVSLSLRPDDVDGHSVHIKEAWTTKAMFRCNEQCVGENESAEHLKNIPFPDIKPSDVKILIGANVPEAHLQIESRVGAPNEPIAVKTKLGWTLIGIGKDVTDTSLVNVNLIARENEQLHTQVEQFWRTESFGVVHDIRRGESPEDHIAQNMLEENTKFVNGHYKVGMLWKENNVVLPNNKIVAQNRLVSVLKRFKNDDNFRDMYSSAVNEYIKMGYARKLTKTESEATGPRTWYLPHHAVKNPNKPEKVRVVFDAASTYCGTSLNDNLVTGPDLLNSLFGVLQRFRLYDVALVADIKGMFNQVCVSDEDSDSLRFLLKSDLTAPGPPDTYKMMVHIFGAADSPSCANYALQRTARDHADKFNETAVKTVLRDFYVDDMMISVASETEAINLSKDLVSILACGGFHLTKWMSNRQNVLKTFENEERAIHSLDLDFDELPVHRALGMKWKVQNDCFTFAPSDKQVTNTKRGIVSIVSSIFDPCGILAPFVFRAKCFIQELWRHGSDWDDRLPEIFESAWNAWLQELLSLNNFELPRHHFNLSPHTTNIEIHMFTDASIKGFGAVAYIRYPTSSEKYTTSFLAAKTHVAPIKPELSIPRLELQGAVLAVRLWASLNKELSLTVENVVFWSDSTTVLRYIKNESKRFKPFVANRICEIRELTKPDQWRHVSSENNPADLCTRGLPAHVLNSQHYWFSGPSFLQDNESQWSATTVSDDLSNDDPEIRTKINVLNTAGNASVILPESMFNSLNIARLVKPEDYSCWIKLIRHTAWIMRAIKIFLSFSTGNKTHGKNGAHLLVVEIKEAKLCWIRNAQHDVYQREIVSLQSNSELPSKSDLAPLRPFFDGTHLRVGGRLRKALIPIEAKHQLILPYAHCVTTLIINRAHIDLNHGGPEHIITHIRQTTWPIKARRMARSAVTKCMQCKKNRVKPSIPIMADLPICRLDVSAGPFYNTGVDYFGPMLIKRGRSTIKRWGCLFTCLTTRAVHLELADLKVMTSF